MFISICIIKMGNTGSNRNEQFFGRSSILFPRVNLYFEIFIDTTNLYILSYKIIEEYFIIQFKYLTRIT